MKKLFYKNVKEIAEELEVNYTHFTIGLKKGEKNFIEVPKGTKYISVEFLQNLLLEGKKLDKNTLLNN